VGGKQAKKDSYSIRRTSLICNVFYCTTLEAAHAATRSIRALKEAARPVRPLQEYHQSLRREPAALEA
jgi:hypothetical protein